MTRKASVFYSSVKAVVTVSRFVGLSILQNTWGDTSEQVRHSYFSVKLVWPFVVQTIILIVALSPTGPYQNRLIYTYYFFRGTFNMIICLSTDKKLLELIQKIERFDCTLPITMCNVSKYKGCLWLALSILYYVLLEFMNALFIGSYLDVHLYLMFNAFPRVLNAILFIAIGSEVTSRFKLLNQLWRHDFDPFKLDELRVIHASLTSISLQLNSCFGPRLLLIFVSGIVEIIIDFYWILNYKNLNLLHFEIHHSLDFICVFSVASTAYYLVVEVILSLCHNINCSILVKIKYFYYTYLFA